MMARVHASRARLKRDRWVANGGARGKAGAKRMPARLPCQGGVEEPCTCPQWTFDLLSHLGSHPHDDCHDELYGTTLTPALTTRHYKVSEMHPLSKTQLRNVVAVASGYPDGRSHGLNLNGNSMVDDTSMDDTSMVDDNSITTPAQCRLPMGPPPVKEEAPPWPSHQLSTDRHSLNLWEVLMGFRR